MYSLEIPQVLVFCEQRRMGSRRVKAKWWMVRYLFWWNILSGRGTRLVRQGERYLASYKEKLKLARKMLTTTRERQKGWKCAII